MWWHEKDIIHGSSLSVSIGGHGGFGLWFPNCGIDGVHRCGIRFGGSGDIDSAPSSAKVAAASVTEALGGSSAVVSAASAVDWVVP